MCPSDLKMKAIKDEYSLYCTGEIKNCLIALQVIVKEKECGEMFLWDPQVQSREEQELSWLCSINTPTSVRRWPVLWLSEVCKIMQLRPKQHKIHVQNGEDKVGRRKDFAPGAAGYYSNLSGIHHWSRELFGAPGAATKLCEIFSAVWRAATDPRTDAANIRDSAGHSNCLAVACTLFSNSCLQTLEIHAWISLFDL